MRNISYEEAKREKNWHMMGTIKTLRHLYGYGQKPDCDLLQRFAMINSAKCSGKDDDKSSMPWELYKNCWDHGHVELEKLDPELIVAQGAYARDLLNPQEIDEGEIRRHIPNLTWGGRCRYVDMYADKGVLEVLEKWESERSDDPGPSSCRQGRAMAVVCEDYAAYYCSCYPAMVVHPKMKGKIWVN